jgi:MOSC domain-containing protein YiiM
MTGARVVSVCTSAKTGVQKSPVAEVTARTEHGIDGDAHAGPWHRQVSLLADESAAKMRAAGAQVGPGDFGENVLTAGIDLTALPVGAVLVVGGARLEITQKGKECHTRCAIFEAAGACVMPQEGVFCRVLAGGPIRPGDPVRVEE